MKKTKSPGRRPGSTNIRPTQAEIKALFAAVREGAKTNPADRAALASLLLADELKRLS